MAINYNKTNWRNGNTPAINAHNLNRIEDGVKSACDILDILDAIGDADSGKIKIGDVLVQWGTVGISMSGASGSGTFAAPYYKSAVVQFPEPYAVSPKVLATVQGNWTGANFASVGAVDTAQCSVRLYASSASSTARNVLWVSIGKA